MEGPFVRDLQQSPSIQVRSRFTILGGKKAICRGGRPRAQGLARVGVVPTMTFVLVSQPVLITNTYAVAWPQGDQLLGGGPWHKANLPAAHWLSLPFYTPEGAWPLSQSTWVQRWRRGSSSREGGRGLPPQSAHPPHVHCNRPLARSREPCYFLLWFLGIPAHSASGRLSLPSPSSPPPPPPPPLLPPLLPPLPPPLPPPHLRPNQGREALL